LQTLQLANRSGPSANASYLTGLRNCHSRWTVALKEIPEEVKNEKAILIHGEDAEAVQFAQPRRSSRRGVTPRDLCEHCRPQKRINSGGEGRAGRPGRGWGQSPAGPTKFFEGGAEMVTICIAREPRVAC
jgi:hypothetical protein